MNNTKKVILYGNALAKVELIEIRDNKEVFSTLKYVSLPVKCKGLLIEDYEYLDIYLKDNSFYDYDEKEIKPIYPFEFNIIDEFQYEKIEKLRKDKNIDEYIRKTKELGYMKNLEVKKIIEVLSCNLEEKF